MSAGRSRRDVLDVTESSTMAAPQLRAAQIDWTSERFGRFSWTHGRYGLIRPGCGVTAA